MLLVYKLVFKFLKPGTTAHSTSIFLGSGYMVSVRSCCMKLEATMVIMTQSSLADEW